MAAEYATLMDLLDRIDNLVGADPDVTVKGLGILLLGKRFKRATEDEEKDPTTVLLRGQVRIPEL